MFETLTPPEQDKIIKLMAMFVADDRPGKIDLGVGVYRTADGRTPVMAAVKKAEARILAAQETKGYVSLAGDPAFLDAIRGLVLGDAAPAERVAAIATPGGTGAVRQVLEMTRHVSPGATLLLSAPTWPNHTAIAETLGLPMREYRYYDAASGGVDRDGMLADLAAAKAGDLVLLHACCHNPTGADLRPEDWGAVADLCARTGAIPFVDMAYLGFGDWVEADAAGTRLLAERLPEVLIAVSGSKNFGLYRERVGAVLAVTSGPLARDRAQAMLTWLNRQSYAFPPDHGARVVETILTDDALRAMWLKELDGMRGRITAMRGALASALREASGSDRFGFFAGHKGMFSLTGARPEQVDLLREKHAIYLVGDGRMNVAGLTEESVPTVARALAEVLSTR